jgi:transposase InsO family protein
MSGTTQTTGTALLPAAAARAGAAPARAISPSPTRAGARFDVPEAKAWLTAAEAAAENLPSFGYEERQIRRFLASGDIAIRPRREGKGRKGREFHWTSLPRQARDEYLKRHGVETIENPRAENSNSRAARRGALAEARWLIVKAADRYIADHNMPVVAGQESFCAAYNAGRTRLDDWVHRRIPELKRSALRTWARAVRKDGVAALEDKRGRKLGTGQIENDARLRAYIIKTFAERGGLLTAEHYVKAVRRDLGQEVSKRTMQAFLKSLRDSDNPLLQAFVDPDGHRSHFKPAFGSLSRAIVRLNQRWEIDATRADAMCLVPDINGGMIRRRCAITALIDVTSRRAMCLVADQGRAIGTMALLRRAILKWGLPEVLKADNGKDFVAASVLRFCRSLDIEVQLSRVFTPEQKGHVERFFGTLNHELFPLLPGFVGANVVQRTAIRNRESFQHRFGEEGQLVFETTLTPGQLQARIDAWLSGIYEHRLHSGTGQAPAAIALALADQVRVVESERALDGLLMDAPGASGIRVVGKKGIQLSAGAGRKRWYVAPELGPLVGYRVHVSLDPADDGRVVVYDAERTHFICIAEDAAQIENNRLMAIAREAQRRQRAAIRLVKSYVSQVQGQFPGEGLADRILGDTLGDGFVLADDAAKAQATAARPQVMAAERAMDALEARKALPQPQAATPEEQAAATAYIADMTPKLPDTPATVQCDGYARPAFASDLDLYCWFQDFIARGNTLDGDDQALFDELRASPAFNRQLATRAAKE